MIRNHHVFGKSPILLIFFAGYPQNAAVIAEVNLSPSAMKAFSAINSGVKGYPIAYREMANPFPYGFDNPGGLVPHNNWRYTAARGTIHSVDIAPADGYGLYPY
jgi:hypothetical protein